MLDTLGRCICKSLLEFVREELNEVSRMRKRRRGGSSKL
jgi:hypothetical protein